MSLWVFQYYFETSGRSFNLNCRVFNRWIKFLICNLTTLQKPKIQTKHLHFLKISCHMYHLLESSNHLIWITDWLHQQLCILCKQLNNCNSLWNHLLRSVEAGDSSEHTQTGDQWPLSTSGDMRWPHRYLVTLIMWPQHSQFIRHH